MKRKPIMVLLVCIVFLFTVFFVLFIDDEVSADDIINSWANASSDVDFYKYKISGSIISNISVNGNSSYYISDLDNWFGQVDSSNGRYYGWFKYGYSANSIDNDIDIFYFVENNSYFYSTNNMTWDCASHNYFPGYLKYVSIGDDRDYTEYWYTISHLDRFYLDLINNASFERLTDEEYDDVDCYVVKIVPDEDNLYLNKSIGFFDDEFFPQRRSNKTHHDFFNDYLDVNVKFWIDKETNLLKKASLKTIYNYEYSYNYSHMVNSTYYKNNNNFEFEILFFDYDVPFDVDKPWQGYITNAKKELKGLDLIDTELGYGFNPPIDWMNNSNLTTLISGASVSNFSSMIAQRLDTMNSSSSNSMGNYCYTHGNITINNMDGYELIINYTDVNSIYHEFWIHNEDRFLLFRVEGITDDYNNHISDLIHSLNESLIIVSPYYQIT